MKRFLLALPLLLLLNGCETWNSLSPGTQDVLKAGAKLALSFGVQELGQSVKEIQPYQSKLQNLIEVTFTKPLSAEASGVALKKGVAEIVPPELQPKVLASFKDSLTGAKTTAASPGNVSFNQRVAKSL
jgi:hypothetical protein